MRKLENLFERYETAHQNRYNKILHSVGIPAIIVGTFLFCIGSQSLGLGLFAIGWFFQILGHAIEGTLPEFMKNPVFLFIGPLYFANKWFVKKKSSNR